MVLELFQFDITFEVRKALKAQTFADFLAEFTPPITEPCSKWMVFTDRPTILGAEGSTSSSKALKDWRSNYPSDSDSRRPTTRHNTKR